jgi:alpha-1,3-glucosyltransferase
MRGDLEAQRHWIALTSSPLSSLPFLHTPPPPSANLSIPASRWYFHDSPYWGLDYPPLTAYHSLFLGFIARLTPSTARFVTLRPVSSTASKAELRAWDAFMAQLEKEGDLRNWMRATVVVGDVLLWVTAVLVYCRRNFGKAEREVEAKRKMVRLPLLRLIHRLTKWSWQLVAAMTILLQPALILIDNGHFQ